MREMLLCNNMRVRRISDQGDSEGRFANLTNRKKEISNKNRKSVNDNI